MSTSPKTPSGLPRKGPGSHLRKKLVPLLSGVILMAAAFYIASMYFEQQSRMAVLKGEVTALQARSSEAKAINRDYRKEIELLQTDEYVEMVARRELGFVKPGEIPYMTGLKRR